MDLSAELIKARDEYKNEKGDYYKKKAIIDNEQKSIKKKFNIFNIFKK